ncbi:MAG: serine/threonine-protein kinase [Verrucomicrobiota bacterium]
MSHQGSPPSDGPDRSSPEEKVSLPSPDQTLKLNPENLRRGTSIRKLWEPTLRLKLDPTTTITSAHQGERHHLPKRLPTRHFALPVQEKASQSDYTVLSKIADGGMGSIYVGAQNSLRREVVIKTIQETHALNPDEQTQFLTEALVIGELEHPNIIPIYELGVNEDGLLFYAMKHVKGSPWSESIENLSEERNLEILMRVCDAIAFAHDKKIIHRDLKPENVMLGEYGEVLLMDWGLAYSAIPGEKSDLFGSQPELAGTPAYMAPELAGGLVSKIGIQTDIYLLGSILFEIITGNPPHLKSDDSLECLKSAAANEVPQPKERTELSAIALRALATEPEDRFSSVLEFQQSLKDYNHHAESLSLGQSGRYWLDQATTTKRYEDFQTAIHACEQALVLWEENQEAEEILGQARLSFARIADKRGDFDMALSLLMGINNQERDLILKIRKRKEERLRRGHLQFQLKCALIGTAFIAACGLIGGFLGVKKERDLAKYEAFVNATRLAVERLEQNDFQGVLELDQRSSTFAGWEWDWLYASASQPLPVAHHFEKSIKRVRHAPDSNRSAVLFDDNSLVLLSNFKRVAPLLSDKVKDFRWISTVNGTALQAWHDTSIIEFRFSESEISQRTLLKDLPSDANGFLSDYGGKLYVERPGEAGFIYSLSAQTPPVQLKRDNTSKCFASAFNFDETQFAQITREEPRIFLYDTTTGKQIRRSRDHHEYEYTSEADMRFTPNQNDLIFLGKAEMLGTRHPKFLNPKLNMPLSSQPNSFDLSKDESQVGVVTEQGEFAIFDMKTGAPFLHLKHPNRRWKQIVSLNQTNSWALVDHDNSISFWNPSLQKQFKTLWNDRIPSLSFYYHEPKERLYAVKQNGELLLIPINSKGNAKTIYRNCSRRLGIQAVTFGKTPHLVFATEKRLILKDLTTEDTIELPTPHPFTDCIVIPERKRILAMTRDTVLCWSPEKNVILWETQLPQAALTQGAYLSKNRAVLASQDELFFIDVRDGNLVERLFTKQKMIAVQSGLPGKWFITSHTDRTLTLRDEKSGEIVYTFAQEKQIVIDTSISPNQSRLIASTADGHIHFWDLNTMRKIFSFQAHQGAAISVSMTPDGTHLISSGTDNEVRLWSGSQ